MSPRSKGASSRAKGVEGAWESANIFRAHGFEVVRLQNNVPDAGDYTATLIETVPSVRGGQLVPRHTDLTLIVDAKRRERLNLVQASKQVEAVARELQVPCVTYRPNREPWRVSLRLEDFARLLGAS